jgi:hypothetical protein
MWLLTMIKSYQLANDAFLVVGTPQQIKTGMRTFRMYNPLISVNGKHYVIALGQISFEGKGTILNSAAHAEQQLTSAIQLAVTTVLTVSQALSAGQ